VWELRPRSDRALAQALDLLGGRIAPRAALPHELTKLWNGCGSCALAAIGRSLKR